MKLSKKEKKALDSDVSNLWKKINKCGSGFSLASSQIMRIHCPRFRIISCLLNSPTAFNEMPTSGALWTLSSISRLERCTGRKEKWGILLFNNNYLLGNFCLHLELLACLIRKWNPWRLVKREASQCREMFLKMFFLVKSQEKWTISKNM